MGTKNYPFSWWLESRLDHQREVDRSVKKVWDTGLASKAKPDSREQATVPWIVWLQYWYLFLWPTRTVFGTILEPTRTKSLYPAWISLLVSGTLLCAQPQQRLKTGLICSCCSHSYRQLANHNNKESSYKTIIMEYFHFQHVMHIQCPTSVPYVLVLVSGRPEHIFLPIICIMITILFRQPALVMSIIFYEHNSF